MIVSAIIASETADEYERQTATKSTAVLFGFVFLSLKLASGLGKLIAGLLIDFIKLPTAKEAALITPAQLAGLGWSCVVVLTVLGGLGVLIFSAYRSPIPVAQNR
jgi:Na+/melibiose symporter-like transporter